ncbi:hypothetical protein T11_2030 [Trichinella zimbabwensis]|uniref:Uncharacterized protein n=1 Tax=Trichinella zimbabwensis TaxID=268475 RepID=A0A0V1GTT9_9BILA|nr:hypothetical protein T11_2030 [Trichinella zimbabwensis]
MFHDLSCKQFRLLAVERGYRVDESYETSVQWPENCKVDPYADLDWRISAALESFKIKYSGSKDKMVVVFVDKSLESVLRHVAGLSRVAYELYIPPPWQFYTGMWKTDLSTFDSWSFRSESTQELWFILVEEDELPFLRLRSGVSHIVGRFASTTMTERRSRAMGRASFNARFNITDVICAPSFTCFTAADNFIKGFQDGLEDEMKILNIKVDGGLSSTVEGYYLHKQFRSMVVESGFNVDETYETSVKCPENYKIDPYVNLDWRINAALGSIKKKYSASMFQMVAVFVDKCLDNVLKGATVGSWPAFKVHVPSVGISPFILEKFEE